MANRQVPSAEEATWTSLRAAREAARVSQAELAPELKLGRMELSALEGSAAATFPTPEFAERYLAAVRAIAQRRAEAVAS